MSKDKEFEIQLQFLDEAQEYLATLESALLGLASHGIDAQSVNAALRAAHSIKGGAGMMQFTILSQLAHRLEDALKVLKVQRHSLTVDHDLESLLLAGIDGLRQVIYASHRLCLEGLPVNDIGAIEGFEDTILPIFEQLHEQLGEPEAEDASSMLAPEDGQNIIPLLFETEVEGCLQRLEGVMQSGSSQLLEELIILAQELGGLGEMLQIEPFIRLCESVARSLDTAPQEVERIAQAALQTWRRSQALILTGHLEALPSALEDFSDAIPVVLEPDTTVRPVAVATNGVMQGADLILEPVDYITERSDERSSEEVVRSVVPPTPVRPRRVRDGKAETAASTAPDLPENTVRVPMKQLNLLNDLLGEMTIERNTLDLRMKRLRDLVRMLSRRVQALDRCNVDLRTACDRITTQAAIPLLPAARSQAEEYPLTYLPTETGDRFDSLELDRYSTLHLLSQEVMETVVQIQEVSDDIELELEETEQTTRDLNKTARQLQRRFTQVRMRPLSDVVDRFPRAIRELSLQYGKPVELKILGGNTLIDRNILETLNEPLMHLLRNAFDHGIEDPETRQSLGKPEQGTIEIRAFHRSNRTLITLRDDGRGISLDKIRARAQQMGLDEMLLSAASDEELLSLIFEPGFSTSDRVTDLSGRGVGMDVVRSQLRQIRGEIQVDTQAGVGTTFILSVPYNLSITRVLLAESNGLQVAFPSDAVEEMVTLEPERILKTAGSEAFEWQGNMVPLVRLGQWFRFNCPRPVNEVEIPPSISTPTVLLVYYNSQHYGLEVDRSWSAQEVAIRQVEGDLGLPPGFSGCTILGNGRVVPLVSVPELLYQMLSTERSNNLQPSDRPTPWADPQLLPPADLPPSLPAAPSEPTILIVDDSVNVRRFLALTLEKAGYRVEQAKDGQDAIDKLTAGLRVQAIVCDIEMPRLDGYGLLAQIKSNAALSQLPVTMLTSRSGDKHRQLAMNLGATAYFSKPYNEQSLLQTLAQLTHCR